MPIYEYRCASCGHELEAMRKISDPPLSECPACNVMALKKRISPVAFRLKGSGWYETDFKSGQQKNLAGKEDAPGKDKAEGNGAKAEGAADKGAGANKPDQPAKSDDGKQGKGAAGGEAKASSAAKAAE